MKRMVRIHAVVNLFTAFLASLFSSDAKLVIHTLLILLKVLVDLCPLNIAIKFCLSI